MSLEYIFYTYLTYNSYMINGYLYREASTSGADGLEFQYIGYNCNYLNRTGNSRNNIQWKSLNGSFPISIKVLKRTGSGRTDIKYESMTVPFDLTPTTRDCEPNCMFIQIYSTEKGGSLYNLFSYKYRNSFRTLPNIYTNTDSPWFYTYCNNGNIINLIDPITRYIVGESSTTYPEIELKFGAQTEGWEYVKWACKTNSLFQKVKKIKLSNSITYTVEYATYLSASTVRYTIKSPTSITSSNVPASISKIELLAS